MIRTAHPTRPLAALEPDVALLEVSHMHVSYGGIEAVRDVSLRVNSGEVVALIGANGAGKTTTLRALLGLVPMTRGTVRYRGEDITRWSTEERVAAGISLVPEGRAIFPNLTVRENLELGAYLHRDTVAMAETIADVVELFPRLGERMKQEGGTLSGGEQQMLAIGRALMARPQLLLLDEPSLGIAPRLVTQIFDAIGKISKSQVTIVVVEQNTRVSLEASNRAYVLKTGTLALEGHSTDLVADPQIRDAYLGA